MGKRGGKRGGFRGKGGGHRQHRTERVDISTLPKANERFEAYYNELRVVEEVERKEFWEALRRDLPNSFRFTGSRGQALPVQQLLKDRYIPEITSIEHNGELVDPPTAISWYPDQLAWQMTTPKNIIRRFPPFASFQKFLVSETSVGNISRQEIVSMIPPLLMDIKPGMTVLDMCASPGSKAMQLLEMVHGGEEARLRKVVRQVRKDEGRDVSPDGDILKEEMMREEEDDGDWSDDGRATGLLIANDVDYKRAHMLTHQMKRLNSPNIIVTNHDATLFPSIKLHADPIAADTVFRKRYLKFDRILADVPCSGDGTCRKNINVWQDWGPGNALGLYPTQVRILVRSLQMLKVGGRVVYSTCSMNPIENEAVVTSAIEQCGGVSKIEIVNCSDDLPELRRKPGLHSWKVMDKQGRIWGSWREVEDEIARSGTEIPGRLTSGMFPPLGDAEKPALDRCMRVYPHLQDTGGFFIAVLEKRTEIRASVQGDGSKKAVAPTPPPHTSIITAVNAIESQETNSTNPVPKIDALDAILPPEDSNIIDEGVSAAARQNQENTRPSSTTPAKRALDNAADAQVGTKRPKFRDEIDEPAPEGEEDRQVHYPPPPAAILDASRPETMLTPPTSSTLAPPKDGTSNRAGKPRNNQPFEEPFKFLDPSQEDLRLLSAFYSLSPRFPRDRWMTRNATGIPTKTIYYTSPLAKAILIANANSGIKFIHCGIKMFVKQDVQSPEVCPWRIQTEGLPLIEPWVGPERVVTLGKRSTLRSLLKEMFPKVDGEGWRHLGEIGPLVRDLSMGCCVLRVEKTTKKKDDGHEKGHAVENGEQEEQDEGFSERMVLPLWRSMHSLNLMLPKEDRKAMLLRLFDDSEPLQDSSKARFTNQDKVHGAHNVAAEGGGGGAVVQPEDTEDAVEEEEEGGGVDIATTPPLPLPLPTTTTATTTATNQSLSGSNGPLSGAEKSNIDDISSDTVKNQLENGDDDNDVMEE